MLTSKESRLNVRIPRKFEDCRSVRKVPRTSDPGGEYTKFVIKFRNPTKKHSVDCGSTKKPILRNYENVVTENQGYFIQQLFESANSLQENIQMVLPNLKGTNEVVISPHFRRSDKRLLAGSDNPKKRSFSCRRKKSLEANATNVEDTKMILLQEEIVCLRTEIAGLKQHTNQEFSLEDINQKVETLMRIVLEMKSGQEPSSKKSSSTSQKNLKDQSKSNIPPPPSQIPPPISKQTSSISTAKPVPGKPINSNISMKASKSMLKEQVSLSQSINKNESKMSAQQKLKEKSSNIFKNLPKRNVTNKPPVPAAEESKETTQKHSVQRLQSGRDPDLPSTDYGQYHQEISSSDVRCEGSQISTDGGNNPCNSTIPAPSILKQIEDLSSGRNYAEVFLSILSYTATSDFRVNVNEKSTGKLLGFFMVEEEIFQKSHKDGTFDKFLTLFILTPGQSNRKNMILNTFLLAK